MSFRKPLARCRQGLSKGFASSSKLFELAICLPVDMQHGYYLVARGRVGFIKGIHKYPLEGFKEFVYLVTCLQAGDDVEQCCYIIQRTDVLTVKHSF